MFAETVSGVVASAQQGGTAHLARTEVRAAHPACSKAQSPPPPPLTHMLMYVCLPPGCQDGRAAPEGRPRQAGAAAGVLPCLICCHTPRNVAVLHKPPTCDTVTPLAFRTTTPATQPQLQDFSNKQQQLELQYRPVVAQLPALLEQLRPEELSQAAEFAALEGMREPLLQVRMGLWQFWV